MTSVFFGGFCRLQIPRFRHACYVPQCSGTTFPSRTGGVVELTPEGVEMGGPPRLGVVRELGDWRVFLEEGSESI